MVVPRDFYKVCFVGTSGLMSSYNLFKYSGSMIRSFLGI